MIKQISVEELKAKLSAGSGAILVDVREADEYGYCHIGGSLPIPLSAFAERALKELSKEAEILIHCHHGGRSQRACEFLASQGYTNLTNVEGGIDHWSLKIDPKVPRY